MMMEQKLAILNNYFIPNNQFVFSRIIENLFIIQLLKDKLINKNDIEWDSNLIGIRANKINLEIIKMNSNVISSKKGLEEFKKENKNIGNTNQFILDDGALVRSSELEKIFLEEILFPVIGECGLARVSFQKKVGTLNRYADFLLEGERKWCLEVEGEYKDQDPEIIRKDKERDNEVQIEGYEIIKFKGKDIRGNKNKCKEDLKKIIEKDRIINYVIKTNFEELYNRNEDLRKRIISFYDKFIKTQKSIISYIQSANEIPTSFFVESDYYCAGVLAIIDFFEVFFNLRELYSDINIEDIGSIRIFTDNQANAEKYRNIYFKSFRWIFKSTKIYTKGSAYNKSRLSGLVHIENEPNGKYDLILCYDLFKDNNYKERRKQYANLKSEKCLIKTFIDTNNLTEKTIIDDSDSTVCFPDVNRINKKNIRYFLYRYFGFPTFREEINNPYNINITEEWKIDTYDVKNRFKSKDGGQFDIIKNVLSRNDTIGIQTTGSGKSITFQLSAMMLDGTSIVVAPLKSLIDDQVKNLADSDIGSTLVGKIHGGLSIEDREKAIEDLFCFKKKLFYIAPERLQQKDFIDRFRDILSKKNKIALLIIDEAHCLSEWGHDFRFSYLHLKFYKEYLEENIKNEKKIPLLALTATASPKVRKDLVKYLKSDKHDIYLIQEPSLNRPNLSFSVITTNDENKLTTLFELLNEMNNILSHVSKNKNEDSKEINILSNENGLYPNSGIIFTIYGDIANRSKFDENQKLIAGEINNYCDTRDIDYVHLDKINDEPYDHEKIFFEIENKLNKNQIIEFNNVKNHIREGIKKYIRANQSKNFSARYIVNKFKKQNSFKNVNLEYYFSNTPVGVQVCPTCLEPDWDIGKKRNKPESVHICPKCKKRYEITWDLLRNQNWKYTCGYEYDRKNRNVISIREDRRSILICPVNGCGSIDFSFRNGCFTCNECGNKGNINDLDRKYFNYNQCYCRNCKEFVNLSDLKTLEWYPKEAWEARKLKIQYDFKDNLFPLLISTKGFGMGIDKPNIRYIIHYNLPGSIESLFQETGRAGRDLKHSHCVILYSPPSDEIRSILEKGTKDSKDTYWDKLPLFKPENAKDYKYYKYAKCDYSRQLSMILRDDIIDCAYCKKHDQHDSYYFLKDLIENKKWICPNCKRSLEDNFKKNIKYSDKNESAYKDAFALDKFYKDEILNNNNPKEIKTRDNSKNAFERQIYRLQNIGIIKQYFMKVNINKEKRCKFIVDYKNISEKVMNNNLNCTEVKQMLERKVNYIDCLEQRTTPIENELIELKRNYIINDFKKKQYKKILNISNVFNIEYKSEYLNLFKQSKVDENNHSLFEYLKESINNYIRETMNQTPSEEVLNKISELFKNQSKTLKYFIYFYRAYYRYLIYEKLEALREVWNVIHQSSTDPKNNCLRTRILTLLGVKVGLNERCGFCSSCKSDNLYEVSEGLTEYEKSIKKNDQEMAEAYKISNIEEREKLIREITKRRKQIEENLRESESIRRKIDKELSIHDFSFNQILRHYSDFKNLNPEGSLQKNYQDAIKTNEENIKAKYLRIIDKSENEEFLSNDLRFIINKLIESKKYNEIGWLLFEGRIDNVCRKPVLKEYFDLKLLNLQDFSNSYYAEHVWLLYLQDNLDKDEYIYFKIDEILKVFK